MFNCGIGMAVVVTDADAATELLRDLGESVARIGHIAVGSGAAGRCGSICRLAGWGLRLELAAGNAPSPYPPPQGEGEKWVRSRRRGGFLTFQWSRIQHGRVDRRAAGPAGYPAEIALVVANRPDAAGLVRAHDAGVATACIEIIGDSRAAPRRT